MKGVYTRGQFALELENLDPATQTVDKWKVGLIKSIEGGAIKSEALTYQDSSSWIPTRVRGRGKIDDIKIQGGLAMGERFLQSISDFVGATRHAGKNPAARGAAKPLGGAIEVADFEGIIRLRREFSGAYISEVSIPKFDANDNGAVYLGVTLTPETIKTVEVNADKNAAQRVQNVASKAKTAAGRKIEQLMGVDDINNHKAAKASRFSFSIDGYEDMCKRINRFDGYSLKMKTLDYVDSNPKAPFGVKIPGKFELPQSLSFTLPEVDAMLLLTGIEKAITEGKGGVNLTGEFRALDNEGKDLFMVSFAGINFLSAVTDGNTAMDENIKLVTVTFSINDLGMWFNPEAKPHKSMSPLARQGITRVGDAAGRAGRGFVDDAISGALGNSRIGGAIGALSGSGVEAGSDALVKKLVP